MHNNLYIPEAFYCIKRIQWRRLSLWDSKLLFDVAVVESMGERKAA